MGDLYFEGGEFADEGIIYQIENGFVFAIPEDPSAITSEEGAMEFCSSLHPKGRLAAIDTEGKTEVVKRLMEDASGSMFLFGAQN